MDNLKLSNSNPLVDIPVFIRRAILGYWIIYQFFLPLVFSLNRELVFTEEVIFVLLNSLLNLLILSPIIFKFDTVGLFHPLTFPALLALARAKLQDPLSFFYVNSDDTGFLKSSLIQDFNTTVDANFKYVIFRILSILLIYAGYYLSQIRITRVYNFYTNVPITRIYLTAGVATLFFFGFFISQGGVKAYIDSWGMEGGRRQALEGITVFVSFLRTLYFIPLVWYISDPKNSIRNPIFLGSAVLFSFAGFLGSGSRTSLFNVVFLFLSAWILRNRRVPSTTIILVGLIAFLLFGTLGQLRSSVTSKKSQTDLSVLSFSKIKDNLEYAISEGAKRQGEKPYIAVFGKVPEQEDYIYGLSFASILTTYIPRVIWEDKPHTVAYYTGKKIFHVGWSIPLGSEGEVYWNFSYWGLILFFFWGRLFKIITTFFVSYYWAPGIAAVYLIFLLSGASINSLNLGSLLQQLLLIFVGLKFMKFI
ncbi:hypothetical protein GCM10023149_37200 [Mucilaginibacter gynuensis]|uniref:Oligosaccharide repeat unit polymerase n=1 Tax=Mucilaginibacter gynuensis TaxID=1302236 RepID=A0ABP8GXG6_9SPHI